MKRGIVLICLSIFIFGCGSKKRAVSKSTKTKQQTERVNKNTSSSSTTTRTQETKASKTVNLSPVEAYIAEYSDIAQDEMRLYHIPASITLAQGILESGSGRGRLSVEANNHFGIKCHEWTGAKIYHDDDADQECFRKYTNAKYSFRDHSLFLKERKRYYKLFELDIHDYKGWARGLKAAGYATDRKYPNKLISLIERYELYKYDDIGSGKQTITEISKPTNRSHRVVKGDTLYSLSKRYDISVEDLKKLNNLPSNHLTIGALLIVTPKQ